jgi:hypothetical protein
MPLVSLRDADQDPQRKKMNHEDTKITKEFTKLPPAS